MKRLFANFDSVINRLSGAIGLFAGLILFLMALLVTVDVIGRKFGYATGVAQELSGYALVFIVLMALAYTQISGEHITIDLVTSRFPHVVRKWLKVATSVVGMAFCIWLVWYTTRTTIEYYIHKSVSISLLHTPIWLVHMFVPIGLSLFVLAVLADTIKTIRPSLE